MPKIDFSASAKRHFQDASLLEMNNRLPNAGQLFGFCTECGLKALLISLGYPTDSDGSPMDRKTHKNDTSGAPYIREHIDKLVGVMNQIGVYASGRRGAKYLALIPNIHSFSDWRVDYRYYDQAQIPPSLLAWKQAATEMMTMMQEADTDNILR